MSSELNQNKKLNSSNNYLGFNKEVEKRKDLLGKIIETKTTPEDGVAKISPVTSEKDGAFSDVFMPSWTQYVKSSTMMMNIGSLWGKFKQESIQTGRDWINESKKWLSQLDPEVVKNTTDKDMYFCVQKAGQDQFEFVKLSPNESMATLHPNVIDVEGVLDCSSRELVKLSGKRAEWFGYTDRTYYEYFCKYSLQRERSQGMNERCEIVDRENFARENPNWDRCLKEVPDIRIQMEPRCGRDFEFNRLLDKSFHKLTAVRSINFTEEDFRKGLTSYTHLLSHPNFEGRGLRGWNMPAGNYNAIGYDQYNGYYKNHFLHAQHFNPPGGHGLFQDIGKGKISGKIRFGVHVRRGFWESHITHAPITIAVWSLGDKGVAAQSYDLPISYGAIGGGDGVFWDCYVDALVGLDDDLRFEIYLPTGPDGSPGPDFSLGGAYILKSQD